MVREQKYTRRGGGFRKFLHHGVRVNLAAPIWYSGMPVQRDLTSRGKGTRRQHYSDMRATLRGLSMAPSYEGFEYGDFPTAFTTVPKSSDNDYVDVEVLGVKAMLLNNTHATAYYAGEHVKVKSESQTIEGQSVTIPTIVPIAAEFGGAGWFTGAVTDVGNMTGAQMREQQTVQLNYIGVVEEDVSDTVGDNELVDVEVLIATPPVLVPSA